MVIAETEWFESGITIVCGPSSCGKSAYLGHLANTRSEFSKIPVVMAHEYDKSTSPPATWFLHYNTLRAAGLAEQQEEPGKRDENAVRETGRDFRTDPIWRDVLASNQEKRAVLILTPRNELLRRIEKREFVEPVFGGMQPYPSLLWLDQYRHIDLAEHYRSWMDELESNEIPVHGVDGTRSEFNPIADLRAAIAALA